MTTAFVLGGGGILGAHEVGMLRALAEAKVRPDIVVGTSVGAINGAFVAADPAGAAERLGELWRGSHLQRAFSGTLLNRAARLTRSGTHLHSIEPLRQMLEDALPAADFADLKLPFNCVAASIERASARWSPAARSSPPCWPRARCPPCCRRWRSTVSITSTAAWSIPSPSAAPLIWAPGRSMCCTSGGSSAPWPRPADCGKSGWWPSRSPAGTIPRGDVGAAGLRYGARPAVRGNPAATDLAQLRYRKKSDVDANIERAYIASAKYLAAPA